VKPARRKYNLIRGVAYWNADYVCSAAIFGASSLTGRVATVRIGKIMVDKLSIAVLLLLILAACTDKSETVSEVIALTGVSVIDVRTGTVFDEQTIIIRDDRIDYIGSMPTARSLREAKVYDHAGRYVLPGLWDMHVHMRNGLGLDLIEENAQWLRQYTSFGITAVRDAGGDLSEHVLVWRAETANGTRVGPRIFTALQKLDGPKIGWEGSIPLTSLEDVVPAIDSLEQAGVDFVKLYDSGIASEVYLAAIAEAERRGLKSAGHLPMTVMFEEAIAAGLDSVEHDFYLSKAASSQELAIALEVKEMIANQQEFSFYALLARLQETGNSEKFNTVLDAMIQRGAALTPTLHIGRVLDTMSDPSIYSDDPQLAQVPSGIRSTFQLRVEGLISRSTETIERDTEILMRNRALVKAAADRGVIILAGSDTGAVNSYLYPGDSLHHELSELVDSGLTPLQALQGATVDAAEWLDQSEDFGTVEIGKKADLLILERNPLTDIKNSRSLVAVHQAGKYFDSNMLDQLRTLP